MSKKKNVEPFENIPLKGPQKTKSMKINTRITVACILGIMIPIAIISSVAAIFVHNVRNKYDISTVTTDTYGIVNQMQWNETVSDIIVNLEGNNSDDEKYEYISDFVSSLEDDNTLFYITSGDKIFYETKTDTNILELANSISSIDLSNNSFDFSEKGVVIVSHTEDKNYTVVVVNDNYNIPSFTKNSNAQNIVGFFTSRSTMIIAFSGSIFVLAIVTISIITSKSIVGPIKKITKGADAIAAGNLDYEIGYESTNELGQLAKSFDYMREKLKESKENEQESEKQRKEVIAGLAHDLRTPLTTVKGYSEGLKDGIANTPEKQEKYLNTIYTSTCSMENMLDDLLTVSKLELGNIQLNFETVTIDDFVTYTSEVGKIIKDNDFDYEIVNRSKANAKISIDTDRFARVIENIISNSIKYKSKENKGKIVFTIDEYEHSILFEVADNGIGVDEENLSKIFDTLYRTDKARTNVSNGSGLGLSVCKQIVELHGGSIWAQNNSMGGLTIIISLPKVS